MNARREPTLKAQGNVGETPPGNRRGTRWLCIEERTEQRKAKSTRNRVGLMVNAREACIGEPLAPPRFPGGISLTSPVHSACKRKPTVQQIGKGIGKPTPKVWATWQGTRRELVSGDAWGCADSSKHKETHSRTRENPRQGT